MVSDAAATSNHLIRRRVLRSTISNYGGKVVTLSVWFFLTPFILHRLGTTTYGLWALVGSVIGYTSLLDLGIASAVVKYIAEYQARREIDQAQSLIATALSLYTALGLVAIACSAVLAQFFPIFFPMSVADGTTASSLVLLMGIGVGLSIPCGTSLAVLRGLQRFDLVNLISTSTTICSAAATVVVLMLGGSVLAMVMVNIVITLLMQVPAIWSVYRIAPELRFGWRGAKRELARNVLGFSSSLFVIQAAGQLHYKTDEVVIGAFLPLNAVTPYALARKLSETAQLLTDQFMKVLLPLASELHAQHDEARLRELYITSTRLTIVLFLPIGCTIVILAGPILTLWVGPQYASYSYLVAILTLASLIDTSQWPAGSILPGMARQRPLAVIAICAALLNLFISIALIHSYGIIGVALGTLIASIVECLVFVLPYAMRTIGVSITEVCKEMLLPAFMPAIPMVLVLYWLREVIEPASLFALAALAAISVIVYLACYLAIGASETEKQTYLGVIRGTITVAKTYLKHA